MNTTACSSSAISRNVSRSAPARPLRVGGQPGGEDLHERPLQPRRNRLRERGLAGAGRAEEDDGARRHHTVLVGEVGFGQRQDQAAFQQLLLVPHAGDVLPEVAGQDPAAQLAERLELLALHRESSARSSAGSSSAQTRGPGTPPPGSRIPASGRRACSARAAPSGSRRRPAARCRFRGRGIPGGWPGKRSSPGRGRRGRRRRPPPDRPAPRRRRGPFRRRPAPRRARRPARRWWP